MLTCSTYEYAAVFNLSNVWSLYHFVPFSENARIQSTTKVMNCYVT